MRESKVKTLVKEYLSDKGYYAISEYNIGIKPDVVGFKWLNDYEIEAVAVECKRFKSPKQVIRATIRQAYEYLSYFPYVYMAIPVPKQIEDIETALRTLGVGLLTLDIENNNVEEKLAPKMSFNLDYRKFLFKVKQVATALLLYNELFGTADYSIPYPGEVHCYKKDEFANYLISNGFSSDKSYYFGICIEKVENVKKLRNIPVGVFYDLLENLPDTYVIQLNYIETYQPREVSWPILKKSLSQVTREEFKKIIDFIEARRGKFSFIIWRKVWESDEVISRQEYKNRLENAINELKTLKNTLMTL